MQKETQHALSFFCFCRTQKLMISTPKSNLPKNIQAEFCANSVAPRQRDVNMIENILQIAKHNNKGKQLKIYNVDMPLAHKKLW